MELAPEPPPPPEARLVLRAAFLWGTAFLVEPVLSVLVAVALVVVERVAAAFFFAGDFRPLVVDAFFLATVFFVAVFFTAAFLAAVFFAGAFLEGVLVLFAAVALAAFGFADPALVFAFDSES